jgi:hypothetical protein
VTQLLYLLVGAGLTMAAQAVIQLRVVPRVEARKRREDRWERDVLALGELLTAELPDRANDARSAQRVLQGVSADLGARGVEPDHKREVERELTEEANRCVKSYKALARTRVEWLLNRIVGIAPQHVEIEKFILLHMRFYMASTVCTFYTRPDDDFDEEKFERYWKDERERRKELTEAIETMVRNPPPRNPSRLQRARRRHAERRQARQDERKSAKQPAQVEAGEDA